jgi:hypothetical protein
MAPDLLFHPVFNEAEALKKSARIAIKNRDHAHLPLSPKVSSRQ